MHSLHPLIVEARSKLFPARNAYMRLRLRARAGEEVKSVDNEGHPSKTPGPGKREHVVKTGQTLESTSKVEVVGESTVAERETDLVMAANELMSVTRAILLVNADHGSAWNARKVVIEDRSFRDLQEEIKLLNLVLTKHSKSSNAWAHRRWCWCRAQEEEDRMGGETREKVFTVHRELQLCERVAELYPKNYYAWTQRTWVVLNHFRHCSDARVAWSLPREKESWRRNWPLLRGGSPSTYPTILH
ncbi:unnamed protein product [Discosporangium mesarthrocarpum]